MCLCHVFIRFSFWFCSTHLEFEFLFGVSSFTFGNLISSAGAHDHLYRGIGTGGCLHGHLDVEAAGSLCEEGCHARSMRYHQISSDEDRIFVC